MKDHRRLLAIAAAVVAGYFIVEMAVNSWWLRPWREVSDQVAAARKELDRSRSLKRGPIEKGWNDLRAQLDVKRQPDVENYFYSHLADLFDHIGANPDSKGSTSQQQGDFKEYSYDMSLKLSWTQFVELLDELRKSKDLLKPLRIALGSMDKEDRMTVDLKISTIAHSPVPVKGGAK